MWIPRQQENVEIVRRATEAWNRDDWDALRALYDDDVVIVAPEEWPEAGTFSGWAVVREQFERLKESWEEERIEQDELLDLGDRVLALDRWVARGKGSGLEIETHGGNLLTLRGGKIARIEFFLDRSEARRAAGLQD